MTKGNHIKSLPDGVREAKSTFSQSIPMRFRSPQQFMPWIAVVGITLLANVYRPSSFKQQLPRAGSSTPPPVEFPPLVPMGPTADGQTRLKITNAVPYQMTLVMKSDDSYGSRLAPCKNCQVYPDKNSIPERICDQGTTDTFIVKPGRHQVTGSWSDVNSRNLVATWDLQPGMMYSSCVVMLQTEGRTNWDYTNGK